MNKKTKAIIIWLGLFLQLGNHLLYLQGVYNNWTALSILIVLIVLVFGLPRMIKKPINN